MDPRNEYINQTRRDFLSTAASGLGGIALSSLLASSSLGGESSSGGLGVPHFAPRAKRCIFIYMAGAPSHLDLFSYKPELNKLDGEKLPEELLKDMRFAFIEKESVRLLGTKAKFRQHGQSGMWFSEHIPHIAKHADDICMIHSMYSDEFNHHPGQLMMQCGDGVFGLPSMGSWLSYGLGTMNRNLPAYIVLNSGRGASGGSTLWQSGFLPTVHEGVQFRSKGDPVLNLSNPEGLPKELQRAGLDALAEINHAAYARKQDPEISARIANYEMAYRMQASAPELTDLSQEGQATLDMYGVDREDPKIKTSRSGGPGQYKSFASNCLLARRMAERGVRFINLVHATWDHHNNLDQELAFNSGMCDQPISALLTDLKRRGLLDDTLVVWGTEFGRTPLGENRKGKEVTGRDHHPKAFSMFMAGGGTRGGLTYGETDEIGWNITRDPVHVNDFQATLLHLFGMDHERLTYRYGGVDQRLTTIIRESRVIHEMLL